MNNVKKNVRNIAIAGVLAVGFTLVGCEGQEVEQPTVEIETTEPEVTIPEIVITEPEITEPEIEEPTVGLLEVGESREGDFQGEYAENYQQLRYEEAKQLYQNGELIEAPELRFLEGDEFNSPRYVLIMMRSDTFAHTLAFTNDDGVREIREVTASIGNPAATSNFRTERVYRVSDDSGSVTLNMKDISFQDRSEEGSLNILRINATMQDGEVTRRVEMEDGRSRQILFDAELPRDEFNALTQDALELTDYIGRDIDSPYVGEFIRSNETINRLHSAQPNVDADLASLTLGKKRA